MRTTVIVPNHKRDISTLVKSIEKSRVPAELIVIDCGLERSIQRNMGIKRAIKKYGKANHGLLILDSDQSISPTLIGECQNLLRYGYSSIYIPEIIRATSFFGQIRKLEREFYTGTAVDVPRYVRADACPLFNCDLNGPEDADWGNRIPGLRTVSQSVLYHDDDIGVIPYLKKKAYYAKSMKEFKRLNPEDKVLTFSYRCFKIFIEKNKWKKIFRHPILFLGIMALVFTRGVIYVSSLCCHSNVQHEPSNQRNH